MFINIIKSLLTSVDIANTSNQFIKTLIAVGFVLGFMHNPFST